MRSCKACRSTGVKKVKAGKNAMFRYKQDCRAAIELNLTPPPVPQRSVNCEVCTGLGIVGNDTSFDHFQPEFKGKICVIGGGIGGLAFALAGFHRGLDITVFEKDSCFATRSQGYALTMQQGFTQLRKLGFTVEKLRDMGTTSAGHITFDKDGDIIGRTGRERWGINTEKESRRFNIQVPRQQLRYELLQAIPHDMVKWGKKLVSVDADKQQVYFADNTAINYDLLVAADGIWSHFTSHYPLQYLGVIVILGRGRVHRVNEHNLGVDKIWQTVDGVTRMYAMPFGIEGETMWQLSWKCPEEEAKSLMGNASLLLAEAKRRVHGWHDPWAELLESTSEKDVTGYPAYDRWPLPSFEDLMPNLAVLGDAAHPLSPFKGQGANQALADGVDLAMILCGGIEGEELPKSTSSSVFSSAKRGIDEVFPKDSNGTCVANDLTGQIFRFHRKMLNRVGVKVEQSHTATGVLHSADVLVKGDHTRGKLHK